MVHPDDETMAWVESVLGPFRIVTHFAHSHAYSQLWRLEGGGRYAWLKMHAHPHKWAGEVHALSRWSASLGRTPTLLGARVEPEAVLLSEVPGTDAAETHLDRTAEACLWREAGEWLQKLHQRENGWFGNVASDGSPHGTPSTHAEAFLGEQWDERLAKARSSGLLEKSEIDFVASAMRDGLPLFEDERACAIHRDYTPRNWRATPDGGLAAVIDLEHARWDVRAADLQRPWSREFLRNPDLIDAFYDGYGGLPDRLRAQVETLRAVMALTTVVWATGVSDLDFAQEARNDLQRLMAQG